MRIVVLAGGLSMERNVSLSSGNKICRALRSRGHQAILLLTSAIFFLISFFIAPKQRKNKHALSPH